MDAIKVCVIVVLLSNLLLLLCYGLESNLTYSITPTSNDLCPKRPCLTLSQFARSPSTRIKFNTTLVFLPGKHSLGWKLSIADIENFSMTSIQTDSSTEIICHQFGGLHFTDVRAIYISSLDFVGCAKNRVENVDNFTLEDSNFFGEESRGTSGAALELYSTKILILRSSFKFYRGTIQQVHSIGCTMSYIAPSIQTDGPNTGRYRIGGAIFTINSRTTIVDSVFERNSANIGGAIFAECYSSLTIINSVFTKNHVQCHIDTITFSKCYGGGVLYAGNGVDVTIYGSQFHLNTAYKHLNGGVLMAELDTIINIHSSQFMNNRAISLGGGGVIYITDSHSTSNLVDTNQGINTNLSNNFPKNSSNSEKEGELKATFGKVVITNSKFFNNFASNRGGVIRMDAKISRSIISITDSKFFRNSALISGGVIDICANNESVLLNIVNSNFTGNSAGTNGGVIYSDQASMTISGSCKFDHNTALDSGGVIINYQGILKLLDKCKFSQNKAYNDGGVIHTYKGTVSITNGNSFNSNMAYIDGGVIYAFGSDLNISRANIFYNNTAYDGGTISAYKGCLTIVYRNIFRKNVAYEDGGVIFAYQSNTNISEENIFSHNMALNNGGAVHAYQQKLDISGTKFLHNKANNDGGVIWAHKANTKTTWNVYNYNYARNRGGVWNVYEGSLKVLQSNLCHNEATNGGAIFADMENIVMESTSLVGNRASKGGALHTYQSILFIIGTGFNQNFAQKNGGRWLTREGNASVMDSVFDQISASSQGGTWHLEDSNVILEDINITDSSANIGAALYATGCTFKASKSLLITGNTAHKMGTVYLSLGSFVFNGEMEFSENHGSFVIFKSNAIFLGTTMITNCSEPVRTHDKFDAQDQEGGGFTLLKSHVVFSKSTTTILLYNNAEHGGGIHAAESRLHMYGEILLESNLAKNTGGGLYLYHSELNSQGSSSLTLFGNEAAEKGGGIHAISSTVNIQAHANDIDENNVTVYSGSKLYFVENKAKMGGGLYLDIYAKLYVLKSAQYSESYEIISFACNLARYGGAIYESECSDSGTCPTRLGTADFMFDYKAKKCSIQIISVDYDTLPKHFGDINKTYKSIFFHENSATVSGSSLFEGLKRRCTIRILNEQQHMSTRSVNGISYLINISNITKDDIGSKPAQLCFCKNGKADCLYQPHLVRVMKGGSVSVELVAIDSADNPVNAIVHSTLLQRGGSLGEGQVDQVTNKTCTEFNFNIFSKNDNEVLNMHIFNTSVKQTLNIQFTTCNSCPVGFIRVVDENNVCECICDPKLEPYITVCNISQEMLIREGDFWITYINTSGGTTSGYLIYPFCPYNYCIPPTSTVEINLNLPDGADSQCANGHSGLLCGQCRSGLSLSLGSSRCMSCSTKWPIVLTAMLTVAFLAGIVLVALLMSINLTVAIGTLNSIIFYANIVEANSSIFLPFSKPNIATVFRAWLNLQIGFDTCIFEGMDAFWKTLLQLAFPLYVISLVVVIIFTSEHSTRFAKLLARINPVATLATLILLSYSKLLQTIIASLSFATLLYPDGSHQTVWLPDASVEYLKGKHIVLFIIAILILLSGGIYTTLLFTWQWLLRHQDKTLLRWMKYQKLCHFIEPYHAPYVFSQRYWFGLLLIARIPVYIVSAVTNNPRVKLLSTSAVIICLLLVKLFSSEKQIYRKRLLDVLDAIMYTNIISFSALTWYTLDMQQTHAAVAYISVCVTFTLLVCVVLYHMLRYTSVSSAIHKTKMSITKLLALKTNTAANRMSRIPDDTSESMAIVTYSTVELSDKEGSFSI